MPDAAQKQQAPSIDLRERVPHLTDTELASLNANAQRLKTAGTAQQRAAATDLLPVIEAELADRRAKKLAAMPPKGSRATKKKAVAKAEPAESAGE